MIERAAVYQSVWYVMKLAAAFRVCPPLPKVN